MQKMAYMSCWTNKHFDEKASKRKGILEQPTQIHGKRQSYKMDQ